MVKPWSQCKSERTGDVTNMKRNLETAIHLQGDIINMNWNLETSIHLQGDIISLYFRILDQDRSFQHFNLNLIKVGLHIVLQHQTCKKEKKLPYTTFSQRPSVQCLHDFLNHSLDGRDIFSQTSSRSRQLVITTQIWDLLDLTCKSFTYVEVLMKEIYRRHLTQYIMIF